MRHRQPRFETPTNPDQAERWAKTMRAVRVIGAVAATGASLVSIYANLTKDNHDNQPRHTMAELYEKGPVHTGLSKQVARALLTESPSEFKQHYPDQAASLAAIGKDILDTEKASPNNGQVVLIEATDDFLKGEFTTGHSKDPLTHSQVVGEFADSITALAGATDQVPGHHNAAFQSYESMGDMPPTPDTTFMIQTATPVNPDK